MYTETKRSIQERKNIQIVMMSKILIWIILLTVGVFLYNVIPHWILFTIGICYMIKDVLNDRNNE